VKRRRSALEPLGLVLSHDPTLRVPATVETTPIPARDWEAAVGSRIAARARPVRLDRRVLVVRTATATWAQELALLADAILTQLRGRGIAVDTLRFRVGPVDAPERPPSRSEVRTSPPEVPLPPSLEAEVERVPDPELRAIIAHAAAKNLGWQVALAAQPAPPRPTSKPSAARAPRRAAPESAPPDRTRRTSPAGRRGKP
jgi:hypothetical protein